MTHTGGSRTVEEQQKAKSPRPTTEKIPARKAETALTKVSVAPARKQDKSTPDSTAAGPITTEQRRQLIAQSAYFRALSRGFEGGDPVADWLEAEQEVDQAIADKAR